MIYCSYITEMKDNLEEGTQELSNTLKTYNLRMSAIETKPIAFCGKRAVRTKLKAENQT